MSKVLITGDLHLHAHRNDQRRADDGLLCLEWIYKTAKDNGIKTVIFVGDFFHNRFLINTYTASRAFEFLYSQSILDSAEELSGDVDVNTIFVLGNHDLFFEDSWKYHSLKAVNKWATVIDKPTQMFVENVCADFLPYTPTPTKWIHQPPFDKPSRVLFSHLSILDAILNTKYNILSVEDDTREKEVIKAEILHKWEKVWLGHYHCGQKVSERVEYIGSPMQLTFGEAGDTKHVALFDLQTLETQYIPNPISPQFYIVKNEKSLDNLQLKDAYVQLNFAIDKKFELRKKLNKLGVREVEFGANSLSSRTNNETSKTLDNISSLFLDKDKLIDSYMEALQHLPSHLDRDLLKKIGKEIVHSVMC